MNKIRLALVDDHTLVRRGLRSFLESFDDIQVVGEAASAEAALEQLEGWLPDVVLMDLLLPGGMDGLEATRRIRALSPHTQVVVVTAHTGDERVVAALRMGAIGYVRKDAQPELLLAAVRAAAAGQSLLDPATAQVLYREVLEGRARNSLTQRESEVLRLLARGASNRQIATELVVSEETVKTHVGNVLTKLHLAHRAQAIIFALKQGLVSLDEIEF